MAVPDPLTSYNAKRDFAKTREPAGKVARSKAGQDRTFMVQKHDATRLHFDFRLELDGVLKSWAVTRGPSLDPADKRLAVRTEDHPLSYATFEGTIPAGEYGGGTVMLWDRGTWASVPGKDPSRTIEEGHLHFTLAGERMTGEWLLVRMKPRGRETRDNWLLRKVEDAAADPARDLVATELTSIDTGRTMAEIADAAAPAGKAPGKASARPRKAKPKTATKPASGPPPAFRPVQLATLVDAIPAGRDWLHEVKYDGYRVLVAVGDGRAKAYTRTGLDWSDRFATIVTAAARLSGSALIDGEVVVLDKDGRPSFQALQAALKDGGAPLSFFAFDLLERDGRELAGLPNIERKAALADLFDGVAAPLHYADHILTKGEALFESLCAAGYEGVISKRADAPYRGARSQAWLKVKCTRRQEFVIVGWLPSEKTRGFRSLLLGVHGPDGLRYAGKVGTGFDAVTMAALLAKLRPIERKTATVTAPKAAVRGAHWVTPRLVAEVAFAEVTGDGVLRHSSFLGLREDKAAADVIAETPISVARTTRARPASDKPAGITLTNPDRIVFPESDITKGQLVDYYARLADPMLAFAARRPVSLVRCPQGRAKHCFFQKHDAGTFGDHVRHVPIPEKDGGTEDYLYVEDAAGVVACVQMGAIEFHGWGSRIDALERPDRLVFDLDPDEGLAFADVRAAALTVRDTLADLGLVTWPLLSGGKGIHVVAPLDASAEWPAVKDFADRLARALAQAHPRRFTANMKKSERTGRIFLDWLRNQRGATAILPYAVRARANAPVAAPISWDELESTETAARYTIADAAELLERAASPALATWCIVDQTLPDA
ncbi:DNA ligase D [Sphingomonas montana]|uniref:DNA ligase D n=1 Tax=Sphingomonas montana TaxID=1843236 RepID=UPI00096F8ED3|nr:DNA ligase D [Sphingomonas montana]